MDAMATSAADAMATSAALVTLRPWPSKVTAWKLQKCTQLSQYIFKMQKWSKSTSMSCQSDKSITDYKQL